MKIPENKKKPLLYLAGKAYADLFFKLYNKAPKYVPSGEVNEYGKRMWRTYVFD